MKKYTLLLFLLIGAHKVFAQTGDDGWNHRTVSSYQNDVEQARISITFKPEFNTAGHDNFHALINPDIPHNGGLVVTDGDFNMNYIRTYTPIQNNATTEIPEHENLDYDLWNENIQYFDGLGRLCQIIDVKVAPGGGDLVKPVKYDEFGREKWDYLPYSIIQSGGQGAGGYRLNDMSEQQDFNNYMFDWQGQYAKSTRAYDGSPLNRITKQSHPGEDWAMDSGHETRFDYGTNTGSTEVYILEITENNELKKNGYYNPGTLFKNISYDEDDRQAIEYKDLSGEVVLKITNDGSNDLRTYFAYDDFGMLRYVIPPEAYSGLANQGSSVYTFDFNTSWILKFCYYYRYDDRMRNIIKRLPGTEALFMVYNKRDQLVLTQDGNLRECHKWLFTKYDVFNRPVMTGKYKDTVNVSLDAMQAAVDNEPDLYETFSMAFEHGYTNEAFPDINQAESEIHSITFYDHYEYINQPQFNGRYDFDGGHTQFMYPKAENVKGLATATKTKILPNPGITLESGVEFIINVTYYDQYDHVIQTIADNHKGGLEKISHQVNFTGDVLLTKRSHEIPGNNLTLVKQFTYDRAKRLIRTTCQIDGGEEVTISRSFYNEIGQLKRRHLHGEYFDALQTVNYRYNIRGWLTGINDVLNPADDLFAMKLGYNTGDHPQYNGNIAELKWHTDMFGINTYNFIYDGANRLLVSDFSGNGIHSTSYSYDKNGNIETLTRFGRFGGGPDYGLIDQLNYDYEGNQLLRVDDVQGGNFQNNGFSDNGSTGITEFQYDANGNMISDNNKNLQVNQYNFLNLPQQIEIAMNGLNHINYLYDAAGNKLRKLTMQGLAIEQTTDYLGNIVYVDDEIRYILTDEGRVVFNPDGSHEYQYFLKDHLGNTRVTFGEDGDIIQENSYYPFGMTMVGLSHQTGEDLPNKYLYNGKELQDDFGLDWYDYGARFYDPVIGRWYVVDPAAEVNRRWSQYRYAYDNPLRFLDPDGMLETKYITEEGSEIINTEDGSNSTVIVPDERLEEFKENLSYETTDVNGIGWNNYWRTEFGAVPISTSSRSLLDRAIETYDNATDESGALQDVYENLSGKTVIIAALKRVLNQFSNLLNYAPGPCKVKLSLKKAPTPSRHNYSKGYFTGKGKGAFFKQLSKDAKTVKTYNDNQKATAKNVESVVNSVVSTLKTIKKESEK